VNTAPTSPAIPLAPLRVLYADDMREMRELLTILLGREGHRVETVEDGDLAWERLAADPAAFDLLVTDHHMPRVNGLELVARVRRLPFAGKILVLSSEISPGVRAAYAEHRVDEVLEKPVFPGTLRDALRALFAPTGAGA
jgi:CheY-like chemotaxis protein